MNKILESNEGYIIQSTIKNNDKEVTVFYKDEIETGYASWLGFAAKATIYPDLERLYQVYEKMYSIANNINPGTFEMHGDISILKIKVEFLDAEFDSDILLQIRQKNAIRKLSKKDVEDLGISDIAALHKLSHDEEDGEFFRCERPEMKHDDDSLFGEFRKTAKYSTDWDDGVIADLNLDFCKI